MRGNPLIVVGPGLLGLVAGLLARRFRPFLSGLGGFLLGHAPWIVVLYTLFAPMMAVGVLLMLLAVESTIAAIIVEVLEGRLHIKEWVAKG
jgi:hypothetical protein